MDLSKMCPKDKQRYEIASEALLDLLDDLMMKIIPEGYNDTVLMVRRAEYKRGKADGSAKTIKEILDCQRCELCMKHSANVQNASKENKNG